LKKVYFIFLWYLLTVFFVNRVAYSQKTDSTQVVPTQQGFRVKGAFALNTAYNTGIAQYASPAAVYASGTLNFQFGALQIPITGNYSNRNFQYSQPYKYNYMSVAPRYAWAAAQIGTSFMSFSPYSLNGHQYTGVGLHLQPGRWQLKSMYGTLFKENSSNDSLKAVLNFERKAFGTKIKYNGNVLRVGLSVFNARDLQAKNNKAKLSPQGKENTIVTGEFGVNISRNLSFTTEYASSGLVQNNEATMAPKSVAKGLVAGIMRPNSSLIIGAAFKSNLQYHVSETNSIFGIQYERVDPDYQSFGSYYFVNDYENLSFVAAQPFLQQRMFLNASIGLQRDDLLYNKSNSQKRMAAMVSVNLMPSAKFNMGLSYSNFNSVSNLRSVFDEIKRANPFEQLDTLNYRQITQNVSQNMYVELARNEREAHSLSTAISWLQSANEQGQVVRLGQLSSFSNANVSYVFQQIPQYFMFQLGILANINTIGLDNSQSIGPVLGLRKGFFKNKWQNNMNASLIFTQDTQLDKIAKYTNMRYQANIQLADKHVLNYHLAYHVGANIGQIKREYLSALLGYQIRF
jgi:hypothetical protein